MPKALNTLTKIIFDKRTVFSFLTLVCFLIFIVPLYSSPIVPQPGGWGENPSKSGLQGIYIVDSQRPEKLTEEVLQLGVQYVERETGWEIPRVTHGPAPLMNCASWDAEGWDKTPVGVPCKKGWIVVIQDEALLAGSPTDGRQTHGRTFLGDQDGDGWPDFPTDWATIVLTDGSLKLDTPEAKCDLPPNAYANLWTHELLHGLGYGHSFTRIIPGVDAIVMERTGHILNDNLCDAGWSGRGLDEWSSADEKIYREDL